MQNDSIWLTHPLSPPPPHHSHTLHTHTRTHSGNLCPRLPQHRPPPHPLHPFPFPRQPFFFFCPLQLFNCSRLHNKTLPSKGDRPSCLCCSEVSRPSVTAWAQHALSFAGTSQKEKRRRKEKKKKEKKKKGGGGGVISLINIGSKVC